MSEPKNNHDNGTHRYHSYINHNSTALSELSSFVRLPGLVLIYGFPDFFRWLARHKTAARVVSIALSILLTSSNVIGKITSYIEYIISCFAASVVIRKEDVLYSYFVRWLQRRQILTRQAIAAGQSVDYLFEVEHDMRVFGDHTETEIDLKELVFSPQDRFAVFRHSGRFFLLSRQGTDLFNWSGGRSANKIRHIFFGVLDDR